MLTLPRPSFIDRNIATIESDIVTRYEEKSNKTLYPAQPERLMADVLSYIVYVTREQIQHAAEQNHVQYANGEILDHLAQFYGVTRQAAIKAKCTLRFTAQEAIPTGERPVAVIIPAGTRVRTTDGKAIFETLASIEIALNETTKDVEAEATEAGAFANDYAAGEVKETLTTIAWLESVANTAFTHGGADTETDTLFRERVVKAPESFSVAGSTGAYEFHALSAHPSIIDVAVESPLPGRVNVYPLTASGAPSEDVLNAVRAVLTHEKYRPLTDSVTVLAPVAKPFTIAATVTLYETAPSVETKAQIEAKLTALAEEKRKRLGRDIVPNQIIALIQSVVGVYDVTLTQPTFQSVSASEYADCTTITITLGQASNEELVAAEYS